MPVVYPCPTPGLGPDCLICASDSPSKKLPIALLAAEFLDFKMLTGRASVLSMKKMELTIKRMTARLRALSMAAMLMWEIKCKVAEDWCLGWIEEEKERRWGIVDESSTITCY